MNDNDVILMLMELRETVEAQAAEIAELKATQQQHAERLNGFDQACAQSANLFGYLAAALTPDDARSTR